MDHSTSYSTRQFDFSKSFLCVWPVHCSHMHVQHTYMVSNSQSISPFAIAHTVLLFLIAYLSDTFILVVAVGFTAASVVAVATFCLLSNLWLKNNHNVLICTLFLPSQQCALNYLWVTREHRRFGSLFRNLFFGMILMRNNAFDRYSYTSINPIRFSSIFRIRLTKNINNNATTYIVVLSMCKAIKFDCI